MAKDAPVVVKLSGHKEVFTQSSIAAAASQGSK